MNYYAVAGGDSSTTLMLAEAEGGHPHRAPDGVKAQFRNSRP
jgi:hypothetical protein